MSPAPSPPSPLFTSLLAPTMAETQPGGYYLTADKTPRNADFEPVKRSKSAADADTPDAAPPSSGDPKPKDPKPPAAPPTGGNDKATA